MSEEFATPIDSSTDAINARIDALLGYKAPIDSTLVEVEADDRTAYDEDEAEGDAALADAFAALTWQDVIDFAQREWVAGEDGLMLIGPTEGDSALSRPNTWRIVVFATANREGNSFYVNVDEITKSRDVNTRLMGKYPDADQAMQAVDKLTRYVNGWL